jgi:hypothetical protein
MNRLSLFAAAAGVLAAAQAQAATQVFAGQDVNPGPGLVVPTNPNADAANAQFKSFLTGVSTESFEGFRVGTGAPLNLEFTGSAGTLNATLTGTGSVQRAPRSAPTGTGQFAVDGNNYYFIDGTAFTVTFASPIAAFGFYGADLEDLRRINVTLNYAAGGSAVYNLRDVFGDYPGAFLASGSVHFLGFIDKANPFSSVVFSGAGAAGDFLAFDLMTIGDSKQVITPGIPEPATWAMLITGFGLVGFAARRRRMLAHTAA